MNYISSGRSHIVAYARVRLYKEKEGGMTSIHGRLLTPALFHDAEKNAWSSWFIFETTINMGAESLIPMAILFEDRAPVDRLLCNGSTFTIFLDGKTYGEGEIVDVTTVPDDEFRVIFHLDDWPGIYTHLLNDETATDE